MPVDFQTFSFANRTGLNIQVTLEAPAGTFVRRDAIPAGTTRTFSIMGVSNVPSVRVIADDGTGAHHDEQQFELRGMPTPAFIETVAALYRVPGSIDGKVCGRTERFPVEHPDDQQRQKQYARDKGKTKSK